MYVRSNTLCSDPLPSHRKNGNFNEARKVFLDVHAKNLDWPEAVWEAWISFEHLHGSVELVDACLDKVEKAQYQVNVRRAKVGGPRCQKFTRLNPGYREGSGKSILPSDADGCE